MSIQWNQQLSKYVSEVIECLEQNIWKWIHCKRPSNHHHYRSNTKEMNKLQNIRIEIRKYKADRNAKSIWTNIALNYIKQTRYN